MKKIKGSGRIKVAQHLNCDDDVDYLQIPKSLKKLVRQLVITLSGDYIFELNESWNKVDKDKDSLGLTKMNAFAFG